MERKNNFRILSDNPSLKENMVDISIVEFMNYTKDERLNVFDFVKITTSIILCFPEIEVTVVDGGICSLVQSKMLLSISIKENDTRCISITVSEFNHGLKFRKEPVDFRTNLENYLLKVYDRLILEYEALNYLEKAIKVFNSSISGKFKDCDIFRN